MMHRGKILEKYIRREHTNLTKLADSLPWTVKTIYRHFEDEDLSYDKLLEYANALKYDFKNELPELEAMRLRMAEPYAAYKIRSGNSVSEGEYYRKKYEEVLEKYNSMLERYNTLLQQMNA